MPEIIVPRNETEWLDLRKQDVTSTEVSALFGISPYCTEFELWQRKKNGIEVDFEPNERTKWGLRLQDSIAYGLAEEEGWLIRRMDEYMRDPIYRMGSSFDFSIEPSPTDMEAIQHDTNWGLLEIKNVDSLVFRDSWAVDGKEVEAPAHIELQVQHQLAVSGRTFAYIGVLVGGNRPVLIKRDRDPEIIDAIRNRVSAFWKSIDANTPPEPNFEKDAEFISRLYKFAEPGKLFDARGDAEIATLAQKYKEAADEAKAAEVKKDAIKAQLLMKFGDAEKVLGDTFSSISLGIVGPADISYHREAYRTFRVSWPKVKK